MSLNPPLLVILTLGLTACVSSPEVHRDASVTEVGRMAESEDPDDRRIDTIPTWPAGTDGGGGVSFETGVWGSSIEADIAAGSVEVSTQSSTRTHYRSDNDWSGSDWDQGYLWAGRRPPDATPWSKYHTDWGWELGVAGLGPASAVSASAFVSPVDFQDEAAQSLENPWMIAWQLSLNKRYPVTKFVSLSAGAGLSSGLLLWDYDQPLLDGDEAIQSDSVGFVGLVMPLSLQSHYGPVMTELVAVPTVRLAGDRTRAGFRNDLTQVHAGIPLVLRLGILF